jgi:hypothetical protein
MGMDVDGENKLPMKWIVAAAFVLLIVFAGKEALFLAALLTPWCYAVWIFLSGRAALLDTRKKNPAPIPFMVSIGFLALAAIGLAHLRHPEYLLFLGALPGLILWFALYAVCSRVEVAFRPSMGALLLLGIPCWIYGAADLRRNV